MQALAAVIGRRGLLPIATGVLVFLGVPLFVALDRHLPPPWRERPLPFELVAVLGAAIAIVYARRAPRQQQTIAFGCAIACSVNAGIVIGYLRFGYHQLPRPPAAFPIGTHMQQPLTLMDQNGANVDVSGAKSPVLLMVFRGAWCPSCRSELDRLAQQVPRFASTGIRVYGISSDPPDALLHLQQSQKLPFSLLSDPEQKATSLCGTSMHCLLLFDRRDVLRWGGYSETWRDPPRYEEVLQAAYHFL
ncbi:redoxin domain-containing protein [Pendulispora brunnea]|uniref:thioredoxin-dependent peroxiredoxin n=1 Tax=Pendulispora brunnea TaxID=2905690 RepID=A0ABZ2KUB2_9BACT